MAYGLRIWNASNNIILDTEDRVGRFLGSFTTNGSGSGFFTNSKLVGKEDFFYYSIPMDSGYGGPLVTANLSTGRVDWSYQMTGASRPIPSGEKVYYGAY